MDHVQPDSGRLELQLIRPSTHNTDRNDYRIIATFRWDNADDLKCYDAGTIDWAYEHEILYLAHFDRKIWSEDFSSLPSDAFGYIDNTALDTGRRTTLGFGIFRPERLSAGVNYRVEFELLLPNQPPNGIHPLTLEGEVAEKQCPRPGPWCVGLDQRTAHRDKDTFIGEARGFAVEGDCWEWSQDSPPTSCGQAAAPPTAPPSSAVPPPPMPPPPANPPALAHPPPSAANRPVEPTPTGAPAAAPPTAAARPHAAPPSTTPTTTAPPPTTTAPPPTNTSAPHYRDGTVNGCNSYGQNCDGNPIYRDVPPDGYDHTTWPKIATVPHGQRLVARCWAEGGTTWNYAASHDPPDYGPSPYESNVYFNVQAPSGEWGWIPDTYFVRDKHGRMGLPRC